MLPASQPSPPAPRRGLPAWALLLLVGLWVSSCLGKHAWTLSAPPLLGTTALVEHDAGVAQVLGQPVTVAKHVTKQQRRDLTQALAGHDSLRVLTKVRGPRGEGWLSITADNHDGQGWAGTFSLTIDGKPVLRDGSYRSEGAQTLLRGDFAPDGSPRVRGN